MSLIVPKNITAKDFYRVNAASSTSIKREVNDVKKKWQDLQSITKKKEAARIKASNMTGGGPAPEDTAKSWEQVVIGTLTKSMVEGIDGGVDTSFVEIETSTSASELAGSSHIVNTPTSVTGDSTIVTLNLVSETASLPASTQDEPTTVAETANVSRTSESNKQGRKRSVSWTDDNAVQEKFLLLEQQKQSLTEAYRKRKLEILEEMLLLQRRGTLALEHVSSVLIAGAQEASALPAEL